MLVVNLSPLEIVEDDCKSTFTFDIEVKNIKHAKSLIHRYYVDANDNIKEIVESDVNNLVGKNIKLRSPITCLTDNYKICKTCIGNYNFTSPYIGILAGQYLEERLTQSSMSSHHLSGSATLNVDKDLKNYFGKKLIDIENFENDFDLIFSEPVDDYILEIIKSNPDYRFNYVKQNNILNFGIYQNSEFIENQDAGKIVSNVANLLKSRVSTRKDKVPDITDTYYGLIDEFFKISDIYTIFIEILLANSHVNSDNIIYRYCLKNNLDTKIYKRFSIKSLNSIISNVLSWLYEPNKLSIRNFYNKVCNDTELDKLSVFEKIWLDKF